MSQYDYLVVGAGLSGAVFANAAKRAGKSVLVIDRRDHIAGNIYTEDVEGIQVHRYGAHIFHTSMRDVWDYVNRFAEFNNYVNSPVANFRGSMYNMPFNMNTFAKMWPGVVTPADAKAKIAEQVAAENIGEPANLEEQALSLVGRDIFETLEKGYTEKQWGRDCKDLPASIIKRLPCRFTYDNNYFNDRYQGIPMGGYTKMVANMLEGVEVRCGVEYKELAAAQPDIAAKTIYCGPIDAFYDFKLGTLEYRSLRFETETLDEADHQGVAVVNYTEREIPYTRIIEHKHFEFGTQDKTVITREYPADWKPGDEPYYPINDAKNEALYKQYEELAAQEGDVIFAGRLGGYKYYDMDKAIAAAFNLVRKELDVEPTEEDRYFQGWWASSVQFGDRWKERSARLMESARKAPFSCLYEALALECLYRKEPARAGELLSSALDGAADARTRARLLLEILMAERARGGNKAFLQRADGIRGLMSSSAFLPALEEWLARVAPPPAPPKK